MDVILEHMRRLSSYNSKGEEVPDPRPGELKIDIEAEMPMELKVMRALQSEQWARHMANKGLETFDDANDFDIPEEESEFKTMHEDDSGDILAFEEGVRRGFIEEIPEERKKSAREAVQKSKEFIATRTARNKQDGPDGLRTSETTGGSK